MRRFIHGLVRKGIFKAKNAPEVLVFGASAFVWAYVSRVNHAYRMGMIHGLNQATRWMEFRHPDVAKEWDEYARSISGRHL